MPSSPSIGALPKFFFVFFSTGIDVFFLPKSVLSVFSRDLKAAIPEIETGSDRHTSDPGLVSANSDWGCFKIQRFPKLEND